MATQNLYPVNIGVLGHVDSGKTSLVAALSTTLSTAALDKNPQSRARGITLDLGFSSFLLPPPPEIQAAGYDAVQATLVDCPGHASLIRTVIGGAQIMDAMLLVVDINKGIQTQTAECIVLGEITTDHLVVVLNKLDLVPVEKREKHVKKAKKLIAATLAATKFDGCPVVAVSATSAGDAKGAMGDTDGSTKIGIDGLKTALQTIVHIRTTSSTKTASASPSPHADGFLFYVDHCFSIKGQGTILTGTVARGSIAVGDTLELPAFRMQRRVKSMQMFRRPVEKAQRGDRVGICITQMDASAVERTLACEPGSIPTFTGAVVKISKVRYYVGDVKSGSKLHAIVGHQTVMARLTFFEDADKGREDQNGVVAACSRQKAMISDSCRNESAGKRVSFEFDLDYAYREELAATKGGANGEPAVARQWALLQFEEAVTAPEDALVVIARLDADLQGSSCRIAAYGNICAVLHSCEGSALQKLRIFKPKSREGTVERLEDQGRSAICRGMFGKDSDLTRFIGADVHGPGGQRGVLEGSFGKSGKFRVRFAGEVLSPSDVGCKVILRYKRYVFDQDGRRRIAQ